jgi:hypothetical protein
MAAISGGHTYFMQNTTKKKKAIAWPRRVALIFTADVLLS